MRDRIQYPVNDINQCVEQAAQLAQRMKNVHQRDLSLYRAFSSLAGDKTIGLLAFAIWRGRSQLLSTIHTATAHQLAEADASGVSHAQSRWQEERVALGSLPDQRRLAR